MEESYNKLSDGTEMPELQESVLDDATLAQYIDDIIACTELIEVIPKYAATQYAPETQQKLNFSTAMQTLKEGGYRGLQVRYRYEGSQWWDTLMKTPKGIRIVRIQHDF